MKFSLIEFYNGVEKLENYVNGINEHRDLFNGIRKYEKDQGVLSSIPLIEETKKLLNQYFQPANKMFEYNSIIVSLYGLLENFIESLIKEYIECLCNNIPRYNDLPDEIKGNHYELSANLINNLSKPKYQNVITKEQIVSNLYSCSNCKGTKEYRINLDAFTDHSSNFRDKSINNFLKSVGISNVTSKLLSNSKFTKYLEENGIENGEAFTILNDLAERRNRVSHGAVVNNFLNIDELSRYIHYIKNFVRCLNTVVYENVIPYLINNADNIITLGKPLRPFTDRIIGIEIFNTKIAVNDTVFFLKDDGETYSFGNIQSIQINKEEYMEVDATRESYQVAIRFDCKVKEEYIFYSFMNK